MAIQRKIIFFKKPILILGGLLAFYLVLVLLVLPFILKTKLSSFIQQETGRIALVSVIKFQPFPLTLDIQGVQIQEPHGETLIAFDDLTVQISFLASIRKMALVFDRIILKKPVINIVRDKVGALNLKGLIKPSVDKNQPQETQSELHYGVMQLSILDGAITYTDRHLDDVLKDEILPININIQNLTNVVDTIGTLEVSSGLKSGGDLNVKGNFNLVKQSLEGHLAFNGVSLKTFYLLALTQKFPIDLGGYELFEADYSVNDFKEGLNLVVNNAVLKINEFELFDKPQNKSLIKIPKVSLDGVYINLKQKLLSIKSVIANKGSIEAWLESDGVLNYAKLFATLSVTPVNEVNQVQIDGSNMKDKPWGIKIADVDITNLALDFEDRTLKSPIKVNFKPIDFKVTDYNNIQNVKTPIKMQVGINNGGSVNMQGNTVLDPFSAEVDVKVENVDLEKFQSYYEKFVRLDVIDGALNINGKLSFAKLDQDRPDIQFMGDVGIDRLLTRDQILNKDFVKWESMALKELVIDYSQNNYAAKKLLFDKPYLRVAIRKDKTANLNDILVTNQSTPITINKIDTASERVTNDDKPVYKLGSVQIREGRSDFSDMSLILPFEAEIKSLDGGANGISSQQNSTINVFLQGNAYDLAPVDIRGEISPFLNSYHAKVDFKDLPMPLVTPYMVQFSGYKVEKGRMFLGLNYKIANSDLTATNNLLIDQFELGEQVENPNAVSLPIKLAVALLKDSRGRIKIDVPISGSLDDPQFSFGGVVADALYNGLTNLVTSPFSALAMLVGNDRELNLIGFDAGSSTLKPEQQDKLLVLAKALRSRPNLNLEIKGAAFQSKDWPVIRQDALYEQIKRQRAAELNLNSKKRIRDEYVKLSDEDYKRLLTDLFIQKFPNLVERSFLGSVKLRDPSAGEFYTVAREKLQTLMSPEPERLKALAVERAQAIATALVSKGGIATENIYIMDTVVNMDSADKEIVTTLSLNAD